MVDVVEIKIWGELVGAVRWDETQRLAYFEYAKNFIDKNWDLSPIKMPISKGKRIYSFPENRQGRDSIEDTFKGLPGLLADSLPDRYGNRLTNAWLARNGRSENSMNPVEQLCFIGTRGMGALEFEPSKIPIQTSNILEIDSLVQTAKKLLSKRKSFITNISKGEEQAMIDILKTGTSAGGARPKAIIAYNIKTQEVRSGQTQVPAGFEHYLLKLDGVDGAQFGESSGWGRVEYAYYLMALDCGIDMMESLLFEENKRTHFMTKRFDRDGNIKHHVQTLCAIQHYDYNDMFSFSYEQVFQTMRLLRLTYPEAEQMFRRMVFNVLASNCDDHTKNFAFILKKDDKWRLAPAYDVCFAYDPKSIWVNEQTLSVNGKRNNITKEDLLTIAKANSIKKADKIFEEIEGIVQNWSKYAKKAKVRKALRDRIEKRLEEVYLS